MLADREAVGEDGGGAVTVTLTVWLVVPPAPLHVSEKAASLTREFMVSLPDVDLLPDQPPPAVQFVVLVEDQFKTTLPS